MNETRGTGAEATPAHQMLGASSRDKQMQCRP
jgi:hypothetical protein